jgi:hypothetical protein
MFLTGCQFSISAGEPTTTPTESPTPIPPTATRTPTKTPRPTITSTPEPPRFFTETFDGEIEEWQEFLTHGDKANAKVELKDGQLLFTLNSSKIYDYLVYSPQIYSNVTIDATYENRGQNLNAVSIICRFDPAMGWYEFYISNSGIVWMMFNKITGSRIDNKIIIDSGSNAIKNKGINQISATCLNDYMSLKINGETVFDQPIPVMYQGISRGMVGLAVYSFDWYPVIVGFDEVTVSEP